MTNLPELGGDDGSLSNCNVGLLQRMEMDSGDARVGHSFSILSDNRPIVDFVFATEEDALQAWVGARLAPVPR
jgi:hypothetical protein